MNEWVKKPGLTVLCCAADWLQGYDVCVDQYLCSLLPLALLFAADPPSLPPTHAVYQLPSHISTTIDALLGPSRPSLPCTHLPSPLTSAPSKQIAHTGGRRWWPLSRSRNVCWIDWLIDVNVEIVPQWRQPPAQWFCKYICQVWSEEFYPSALYCTTSDTNHCSVQL